MKASNETKYSYLRDYLTFGSEMYDHVKLKYPFQFAYIYIIRTEQRKWALKI